MTAVGLGRRPAARSCPVGQNSRVRRATETNAHRDGGHEDCRIRNGCRAAARRDRGRPGDRPPGGRSDRSPTISPPCSRATMAISRRSPPLAKTAPAAARRPLAGLKYALPVARPGKIICLGLNYLEHVKEGRYADNLPKFPTLFSRGLNSFAPHLAAADPPAISETFDYEAELVCGHRQAGKAHDPRQCAIPASPAGPAPTKARSANSSATPRSGTWARTSTAAAASGRGS